MTEILGLKVTDLPPNYTPLELVVLVKCLDNKGDLVMSTRYTEGITPWEALGMLDTEQTMVRSRLLKSTKSDKEETA